MLKSPIDQHFIAPSKKEVRNVFLKALSKAFKLIFYKQQILYDKSAFYSFLFY